jgi:predicted DNA-binding protein (MmcQ/YjbR family)
MNPERAREFLLKLPHVVEAEQWGGLLYWVGDKAVGGKTFSMLNLDAAGGLPMSFPVGQERFAEMCEREGVIPAPYAAKNFWVAIERWDAMRDREWEEQLAAAHQIVFAKLPPRTKAVLAMPKAEQKKLVAERKKLLASRAEAKAKTLRG